MKEKDFTVGMKIGRGTFVRFVKGNGGKTRAEFKCDCGEYFTRAIYGISPSSKLKCNKEHFHGQMGSKLYSVHHHMLDDVRDNGVAIAEEWRTYSVFKEWALVNGFDEERGYVRIVRNRKELGYTPENCRFGAELRENWVMLAHNGIVMTVASWAKYLGMSRQLLYARLNRGMTVEQALTSPVVRGRERCGTES